GTRTTSACAPPSTAASASDAASAATSASTSIGGTVGVFPVANPIVRPPVAVSLSRSISLAIRFLAFPQPSHQRVEPCRHYSTRLALPHVSLDPHRSGIGGEVRRL